MLVYKRLRSARIAIGTVVCLMMSYDTLSFVPEGLPEPPPIEEILLLEELAGWIERDMGPARFQALDSTSLAGFGIGDAIRQRQQSFELFRGLSDQEARMRLIKSKPFGEVISSAAERYHVDGLLLAAIVEAESSFNPSVISPKGALGLMQLMPDTVDGLYGYDTVDPMEPTSNINAGAHYLRSLLREFDGDLELALAAYNAGPGNVRRYGGVPPFRETRGYVSRVLGIYLEDHQSIWRDAGTLDWLL